jgi:hypothetical protein
MGRARFYQVACPEVHIGIGELWPYTTLSSQCHYDRQSYFTKSELKLSGDSDISFFNRVVVWLREMGYMAGCW